MAASKVWITRSEPGASKLAEVLRNNGFEPHNAPVLQIVSLAPPASLALPRLIIALSAHAVPGYQRLNQFESARHATHLAVGPATAKALSQINIKAQVAKPSSSEGLLASRVVQDLQVGDVVWLLAGVGGRQLLVETLKRRGCVVVKLELYQRVPGPERELPVAEIGALLIGSGQAAEIAGQRWFGACQRAGVCVIVPSARVAKIALEIGFNNVHNAGGSNPESVLAQLQAHLQ